MTHPHSGLPICLIVVYLFYVIVFTRAALASDEGRMIFESNSDSGHSVDVTGRHCTVKMIVINKMTLMTLVKADNDEDEWHNDRNNEHNIQLRTLVIMVITVNMMITNKKMIFEKMMMMEILVMKIMILKRISMRKLMIING